MKAPGSWGPPCPAETRKGLLGKKNTTCTVEMQTVTSKTTSKKEKGERQEEGPGDVGAVRGNIGSNTAWRKSLG